MDTIDLTEFEPALDKGIVSHVCALRTAGIETYESCQGGEGHSYTEPTIRFHGDNSEGLRALAVAIQKLLPVSGIKRCWDVIDGELTGPCWEMVFHNGHD